MISLKDVVIEALIDSSFIPGEHEAYAFVQIDCSVGGVGDFFQSQLDSLDWDEIEEKVKEAKEV